MVTQTEIASHLDLNQSEVSRHMADLGIDWRVTSIDVIRVMYLRKLRSVASGHKSHDGSDLTHERVVTERLDQQLKELLLAEKRGQLVNLDQLEPVLLSMISAFKTDVLALPDKVKSAVDAQHGIDVDVLQIEELVDATLRQLALYDPDAGAARAAGGPAAAACEPLPPASLTNE